MSADQWQQAKEALAEAMDLTGEQRAAFLAKLQADLPELHDEVVSLLASQEEADQQGFLDGADDTHDQYRTETYDPNRTREYITTDDLGPVAKPKGEKSDLVGDDYELEKKIGQGGMGVVYKAYHRSLRRTVALKIITGGGLRDEIDIARFHIEAEAAARLDHPGIIPVYDVGEHNGNHFYAMAYVEGPSLSSFVGQDAKKLPPRRTAKIMEQVCRAVQYAHDRAVIHRDLKPANIMLENGEIPRLADFGLAKNMHEDDGLTMTGQVMGTPSYMAPEQATGKLDQISNRTDVYSLGATLYALLAGRPPFAGGTMLETIRQVVRADPEPLTQIVHAIPQDLQTICEKCLAKNPQDRYASAEEVADDLRRFLDGFPISARPLSFWARGWRLCQRHPVESSLLAVALTAIIVGSIVSVNYGIQANQALHAVKRNQQELRSALKKTFVFASEDVLAQEPGMQAARATLLNSAQEYYAQLAEEAPDDIESQRELADAQFMLAKVQMALKQDDIALATLDDALRTQESILKKQPEDVALLIAMSKTHNQHARLAQKQWQALTQLQDVGKLREREATAAERQLISWKSHSKQAIELRKKAVQLQPENIEYQRLFASALMNEANALSVRGMIGRDLKLHDQARELFLEAQQVRLAVLEDFPDELLMRRDLGQGYFNQANNEVSAAEHEADDSEYFNRLQRSVDDLTKAIEAYEQLPTDQLELHIQLELAHCYRLRADSNRYLLGGTGLEEVVADYNQAEGHLRVLTDRNPKVFRYRITLAETQYNVCAYWCLCEKYQDAASHLQLCRETLIQGLRIDPKNADAADYYADFTLSIVDHLVEKQVVDTAYQVALDSTAELEALAAESDEYAWLESILKRLRTKSKELEQLLAPDDESKSVT